MQLIRLVSNETLDIEQVVISTKHDDSIVCGQEMIQ